MEQPPSEHTTGAGAADGQQGQRDARERRPGALRRFAVWAYETRIIPFLLIGAVLFAISPRVANKHEIHFSATEIAALCDAYAARKGLSALTDEERRQIERRAIEDEVLYREALRMGLDAGDGIVKQRLVQKVLFLAEELGGASQEPAEASLRELHAATREAWIRPASTRLVHVFATSRERAEGLLDKVEAWSREGRQPDDVPPLGDPFPLHRVVEDKDSQISSVYGQGFVAGLAGVLPGRWAGPVGSKYGWHLVRVLERKPQGPASFEEVAQEVKLSYVLEQRRRAVNRFLRRVSARYRIDLDGRPVRLAWTADRTAMRTAQSAED
jgi:hypothetical protein